MGRQFMISRVPADDHDETETYWVEALKPKLTYVASFTTHQEAVQFVQEQERLILQ